MEFLINTETIAVMAIISAVIIGIAEALVLAGVKKKFIPLIDIGLGLVLSTAWFVTKGQGLVPSLFVGLMAGLSACGLFSGVKNVIEGVRGA